MPAVDRWAGGFTSDDPYIALMALRNRRAPGSFAAARDIVLACLPGMLASEHDGEVMQAAMNQNDYAARLQARQTLVARCHRITHVAGDQLDLPTGDAHGAHIIEAVSALQDRSSNTRQVVENALREFARQGQLVSAASSLASLANWKGEAWQSHEARQDFSAAIELAALRASAMPGTEKSDLRLIDRCYRRGDCSYRYDSLLDRLGAERRERALRLAQEMELALRNNDARPFLGSVK